MKNWVGFFLYLILFLAVLLWLIRLDRKNSPDAATIGGGATAPKPTGQAASDRATLGTSGAAPRDEADPPSGNSEQEWHE